MNSYDVITYGWIFKEYIESQNQVIGPVIGGSITYSSAVMAKLGLKTGMVTHVGNDFNMQMLEVLRRCNVDMRGVHQTKGADTTINKLIYDSNGNKTMNYIKQALHITAEDIPPEYYDTDWAFFCSEDFEVKPDLLDLLCGKGISIVADLGGFGGAHNSIKKREWFLKKPEKILKQYMRNISIAKASEEDAFYLLGQKQYSPENTADRLLDYGADMIVLTLGKKGVLIKDRNNTFRLNAVDTVPGIKLDTTGAGDTYIGAFMAEYIKTGDIEHAGRYANAASSLLIEQSGGVAYDRIPDHGRIAERLSMQH